MTSATVDGSDSTRPANAEGVYLEMNVEHFIRGGKKHMWLVLLSLLVVCFNSGASAAQDDQKAGAEYEKQGQLFRAALSYSRALRLKPGNKKVRRALQRIADRAIDEKLLSAETLEAGLKIDEAIAELDAAARLGVQFTALTIDSEQAGNIAALKEGLVSRRVESLLAEAERARADGMWSAAIAQLKRVEVLRPGSDDTHDRLYDVWMAWSDMNRQEGRLRAAAERLEQASKIPGMRSSVAAAQAAAIRVGLGKSALGKGACRAAVAELRMAERLAPGSVVPELLRQAASCAATCVQMAASADPDSSIEAKQLGLLQAEFRSRLREGASEFLRMQSSDQSDVLICDRRSMPGVDGEPMNVGPYASVLRVTSIKIVRQPASSVTRRTRDQHGFGVETLATHEEYRDTLTGTISGWLTVTDQRAKDLSVPLPVRASGQATARWQGNSVSSIYSENVFTGQRSTSVLISVVPSGKAQADEERRRARSELTETLIRNFAERAAKLLLSTLDVEPEVSDPSEITGLEKN